MNVYATPIGLNKWKLEQTHYYVYSHRGRDYRITVEHGFVYDKATIPRILWPIVHPGSLGEEGPLVHDYLIKMMGKNGWVAMEVWDNYQWRPIRIEWKRTEVDKLFFRILSDRMKKWPTPDGWKGKWVVFWRRQVRRRSFNFVYLWGLVKKYVLRNEW